MAKHDHDHDHEHEHGAGGSPASAANALRAEALETLLVEKGLVRPEIIDAIIRRFEEDIGPLNGAKVVARAWVDPAYRSRLLADPWGAVGELGVPTLLNAPLVVVPRTSPACTTSSSARSARATPPASSGCRPPGTRVPPTARAWCASRARCSPRWVSTLAADVEVRVWDSSAELRYMVLPERPAGTEGTSEEELRALVTRDTMIGVARPKPPG